MNKQRLWLILTVFLLTVTFLVHQVQAAIDPATVQKLLNPDKDKTGLDYFGSIVSVDGDTTLVASSNSVYVFTHSGTSWTQQAKLTVDDTNFGSSVSVDGDTAVIGAFGIDGSSYTDAAYVFTRSGTSWTQQAKLTASDKVPGHGFGRSVSVDGNTVVIGARWSHSAGLTNAGAAYVFTRSGTSWRQQAKLTASDRASDSYFGSSVSVDGDTTVISSSSGAAYVFTRSGTSWMQQAKLTASDKAPYMWFSWSVSVDGNTVVIGDAGVNDNDYGTAKKAGAAYVFTRSGTSWTQQAKLSAPDKVDDYSFGSEVSVDNDTMVVSSFGGAYMFTRSGTSWTQQIKLSTDSRSTFSVSVSGDTAVIGHSGGLELLGGSGVGAVYVYGPAKVKDKP